MSTYVLIHGAWHGSWCWDKVVPLLKKKGHKVEAPDLPGHGRDKRLFPESHYRPMLIVSARFWMPSLSQ